VCNERIKEIEYNIIFIDGFYMVKKNKIDFSLIDEISDSAGMTNKAPVAEVKDIIKQNSKSPKEKHMKQKLISLPHEWDNIIKEYLAGGGTVSSYILQAIREKLKRDDLL
jgi:hypothetical protein